MTADQLTQQPTNDWTKVLSNSTPRDLGFERDGFRPAQTYALSLMLDAFAAGKKYLLCQLPTGTGKTLASAACARIMDWRTVYTCTTKQLQDQAVSDVPFGLRIKGRANYPTLLHDSLYPDLTCADCDKESRPRSKDGGKTCTWCGDVSSCPYESAKHDALAGKFAITNTKFFLTEANHVGRMSGWDLVILDEADEIEHALMEFVSVQFSSRLLDELGIGGTVPKFKGATETEKGQQRKVDDWGGWLDQAVIPAMTRRIGQLEPLTRRMGSQLDRNWSHQSAMTYARTLRHLTHLKRLVKSVETMRDDLAANPESWVRAEDSTLTFKPVRVSRHAHQYLWRHSPRWIIMSATLISHQQFCDDLGLPVEETEWIDVPSMFPVENRPVFYWPVASMSKRNQDQSISRLVDRVDQILDHYTCRVLVHTHTYAIAERVFGLSRHQNRMVTYLHAQDRDAVLDEFKSRPGAVLVAPSMERGLSLDGDLARCVIVCKTPFPNLGDRQIRARFRDGTNWYSVQTVRAIVQMTGRATRSETDWSHCYILDSEFGAVWKRSGHLFPEWWREAMTRSEDSILAAMVRGGLMGGEATS